MPVPVKHARVQAMAKAFRHGAEELHRKFVGQEQLILIEGPSKKTDREYYGRNDANIKVIVPRIPIPVGANSSADSDCGHKLLDAGDFIVARVSDSNSQSLKGLPLYHSSISSYATMKNAM